MGENSHLMAVIKKPQVWLPFLFLIIVLIIFSAYNFWQKGAQPTDTSKNLRYANETFGFAFTFPDAFQYFQTQAKEGDNYSDIEIFVPTTDRQYSQEVLGYAKPIVVRMYKRQYWESLDKESGEKKSFLYQGIKNDLVYTIKFWDRVPVDWEGKWSEDMKNALLKGFTF